VITLQTPAQEHEVRALMRKASVVPLAARVRPGSALLRSIAGEPAEPIAPVARPAGRETAAAATPAHRPRRGRHVHALPGPRQALTAPGALAHSDLVLGACDEAHGWR